MLRRTSGRISELSLTNQHEIANVNDRVRQIRDHPDRVAPEKEIQEHDDTAANAPVPERNWNDALTALFRGVPLDKEAHRKGQVSNQSKDHEIIPVQPKETM